MKVILVFIMRFYQVMISPYLPKTCRFEPTCSHYAIQSVKKNGSLKGLTKTLVRILKCHPFHPGGYDPVL